MSACCGSGSAAARSSIAGSSQDEGLHVLLPWDKLFLYDLRLQIHHRHLHAISKDGVNLGATINIRFRLQHDSVPKLHQTIGPDYLERLVRPEIGNRVREVIAEYTAEEVYSTKRQEIQEIGRTRTKKMIGQSMAERRDASEQRRASGSTRCSTSTTCWCSASSCRRSSSPRSIARSSSIISCRNTRSASSASGRSRSASRSRRTASAISSRPSRQGISDSYLRWRGIEATLQLAQSPNTKIVIIGSGKDGLPVILGNVDTPRGRASRNSPAERTTKAIRRRASAPLPRARQSHWKRPRHPA